MDVTETIGEDAEGKVLQAIAGEGNAYAMVIMEITDDGMKIRLPSNLFDTKDIKALLKRTVEALE